MSKKNPLTPAGIEPATEERNWSKY